MYSSPENMQSQFYGPLVNVWMERIRAAQASKSRFNDVGKICNDFYESQKGFMWKSKEYFNGQMPEPRFAICIAKAFEFVAIYGPHLFWQYADRSVISQRQLELTPDLFGDPNDPEIQQAAQQFMAEDQASHAYQEFINEMMSIYLNWSQREQPGTLMQHGMMAIIESLIKGMGLLWPETYVMPGSEDVYTRLNYDTVDNLLIDPDCKDPLWETAGYIVRRHFNPIWQVERKFGLERGTLDGKGTAHSSESMARQNASQETIGGRTFDCIEWYEIWSKVGVGPRTNKLNHHMVDMFDDAIGDFAYLCISPNVQFPLNAPTHNYFGDSPAGTEDIEQMFRWRCAGYGDDFEVWRDGRWPVSALSYNPVDKSPWPMAPLSPGLGELIAINVLTSSYVDQAWENRKRIIACAQSAFSQLEEALSKDRSTAIVKLNDNIHGSINEIMQMLDRPMAQGDQLQAMQILSENFNRRVGLNELQYGESRTQIRVAADSRQKTEALSIRPQKMSGDVARWMTDASQKEMFLAAMHVEGQSLTHLLGAVGAQHWDQYFQGVDINQFMRESKASVEASEIRRPNKERDTANIQSLQQYLLPMLQVFAQETGNTEPLNVFLSQMGEAMDMHEPPAELPEWRPPVDPEQQQIQQEQQQVEHQLATADAQAEIQRKTAEAASKEADAQKKAAEAVAKQADAQKTMIDATAAMVETQVPTRVLGEIKHQQDLRHAEETHQQNLAHKEQEQVQGLLFTAQENNQKQELDDGEFE